MNAYPAGTRVFFWTSNGECQYATVDSSSRLADGTLVLVLKVDGKNELATLPAGTVAKVT